MSLAYDEYLKSQEWQSLRLLAIERADGLCEFCGNDGKHVHHVRYPKNFSDDELDNLVVACRKCHELCHGIRKEQSVKAIRMSIVGTKKYMEENWSSITQDDENLYARMYGVSKCASRTPNKVNGST